MWKKKQKTESKLLVRKRDLLRIAIRVSTQTGRDSGSAVQGLLTPARFLWISVSFYGRLIMARGSCRAEERPSSLKGRDPAEALVITAVGKVYKF
ncbi:hypothetical protein MRB53_033613 [Persea americana]|uniref:Uncharacterized protein n=1 Tax=Persea americana TaxID=3435 RepID=A0ACC2KVE5_PERAE|nr:hypothetical protein MRB53_033613 [Persea americana]